MTLFEHVTDWMYQQQKKHSLDEAYPEVLVNGTSNWELLQSISDYLEQTKENTQPPQV